MYRLLEETKRFKLSTDKGKRVTYEQKLRYFAWKKL